MRMLTAILMLTIGCTKPTECPPNEPIGCMCNNGNIYAPTISSNHQQACIDSCINKGGMNRLFCK